MDNYNRYKANGMRDRFKRKISKPNNNTYASLYFQMASTPKTPI